MEEIKKNNEEWKMAILRAFYVTFQNSSCYFVGLIIVMRLRAIRNPLGREMDHVSTKKTCIFIWCISVVINLLPVASSVAFINETKNLNFEKTFEVKMGLAISFILVLYIGVIIPLALTIIANISLIVTVRKIKHSSKTLPATKKNMQSFEKLTNGLVLWSIICNVPYIIWYHVGLYMFMTEGKGWDGLDGVFS